MEAKNEEVSFNLETAIGPEKSGQAIEVQKKFLQLVVTLQVMRDCKIC